MIINMLKKELKEMFRDKKSLSMMLIIPIMIPLLIVGMSALFNSESNKPITDYNKIGFSYELSESERELAKNMNIEVFEKDIDTLKQQYDADEIDLYITKEDNKYIINGKDNTTTSYASSLMEQYFSSYKAYLQDNYLQDKNIDANSVINIIEVDKNIIDSENYFANYITSYAFIFIIMAITISATYPATDATAGEKERGTLETLLTFPIKSKDIIVGKFLSVTISSAITGLISLLLMAISLKFTNGKFAIYNGVNLALSTSTIIFAVVVIIAYSFLISGLCIAIASKCKTFKEAQSSLTPLTFVAMFPGMIVFLMNIKSSIVTSLIPFINFTMLFEDISKGNINIINVVMMLLSTIIIITIVLNIIIKQYKSEKVLFTN